ncbi:MAG: hypothetical protein BGN96_08690 [Bacteroidales bacterium 45-6]|nr:MAG: hypothetical protein BGN96_08690 [Bacteroidales bacterium 45-6]
MKRNIFLVLMCAFVFSGCKFSYSFTGTNIDYTQTKTINIHDFTNQATLVYPTLSQILSEKMRDVYTKSTKLKFTDRDPDIEIEGEIVKYELSQQAVKDNAYASETRLTMTVNVRYRNNRNTALNKELSFSTYEVFSNNQTLSQVQEELVNKMTADVVDQIFNGTMANW